MRLANCIVLIVSLLLSHTSKAQTLFVERRQRAAAAFHDGLVLLHASSRAELLADGFHQNPYFYYFTGLENTVGALLAIDGKCGDSWLFLSQNLPYNRAGLQPDVRPGVEDAKRLGIEHVVDWANLESFLASRSTQPTVFYYAGEPVVLNELPVQLQNAKNPEAPLWLQMILQRWPAFEAKEASRQIDELLEVQSEEETAKLRGAAKTTVSALMAG